MGKCSTNDGVGPAVNHPSMVWIILMWIIKGLSLVENIFENTFPYMVGKNISIKNPNPDFIFESGKWMWFYSQPGANGANLPALSINQSNVKHLIYVKDKYLHSRSIIYRLILKNIKLQRYYCSDANSS